MSQLLLQFAQDIRYAARQLRRSPGFTLSILLVLGLGIGANAAIFSILNVTLLRRLPFERPAQLVSLRGADGTGQPAFLAFADTLEWQRQNHTLSSVAFYDPGKAYLDANGGTERVSSTFVSTNLFSTLGAAPSLGRDFVVDEQQPGKGKVVVLSYDLWRSQFQADPGVVGKTVQIDGAPKTVIGVMPKGFTFPQGEVQHQLWMPEGMDASKTSRGESMEGPDDIIARMKPGVQPSQVAADLSSVQKRMQTLYSANWAMMAASSVEVTPYRAALDKDQRPALLALVGAVLMIWLIACANAANLMLARGSARRREIAVRGALGAGRARIVRQLLTESLLLAIGSAAIGIGLGALTLRIFSHVLLVQLKLAQPPGFDLPVLGALLGLTVLSTLLFGLTPALLATGTPIEQALRQDGAHSGSSRSQHRIQRTLVVTEIALSLTLLVACGLLLRTVFALHKVPLGFRTDHVVIVESNIPGYKYRGVDLSRTLYLPLVDRIRAMHGVEAAALTTVAPLEHAFDMSSQLTLSRFGDEKSGSKQPDKSAQIVMKIRASTADLQKVFGFRLKAGRYFNDQDTADSAPVALVNEAFEREYKAFNGKSAIDNFSLGMNDDKAAKVIGVVEDFRQAGVDQPAAPQLEFLLPQLRPGKATFYENTVQQHVEIPIRIDGSIELFIPELRRVLGDANPDLRGATITTMDQIVEDSLGSQILAAHLLEMMAGLALLVALAGLYSLLAYLVTLRTRELGLRIALGADRNSIHGLVLSQAAWLVVAGVAIGTVASLTTAHLLEHFLFGVKPRDVATLVTSAAMMLAVGLLASWLPARRAAQTNPIEALRTE